jgi:hypothetical protein
MIFARRAAITFSRIPPTGSTCPVRVSSPVIARGRRMRSLRARDTSAVAMVMPALGPSLGVAPSGTCRCTMLVSKNSGSQP